MGIFAPLLQEVQGWFQKNALEIRHAKLLRFIAEEQPHIVTLVEYNAPWRQLPVPASRNYTIVNGLNTASILYDGDEFEHLSHVEDFVVPSRVRSEKERGTGTVLRAPKSSCMMLLRRLVDDALFLVAAVHLESGPASNSAKVLLRQHELRAVLEELSLAARILNAQGRSCTLVVAGDFNALREEFALGNGDDFYAATAAHLPQLARPEKPLASPQLAQLVDNTLQLICDGANDRKLCEISCPVGPIDEVRCTRAGKPMVIDYIFAGSVGGVHFEGLPRELVTSKEAALVADAASGVHHALNIWGSDHLPVASDIRSMPRL